MNVVAYQIRTDDDEADRIGTKVQETESEREARIRADVFNPNESDVEYFLRRKRELGL